MSIRFEDASQDCVDLVKEVQAEYFPELRNVKMKVLFDLKKRMSNGKVVLGRCARSNDLVKHLTAEEANDEEGIPYIIYLDKVVFDNTERTDRVRLIRHELRHILIDLDAKNPYKIAPHDIEDFAEEVTLNQDDVRWASRVADLADAIYEQMRDQEAE